MKKRLAMLALCASSSAFAGGLYIGGQFGLASVDAVNNGNLPITDSTYVGGIYGGYEFSWNSAFLAFEGDFSFSDASARSHTDGISVETNRGNVYGLTALAGMPINPFIDLYGRFGWTRTPFEATSADASEEVIKNGVTFGGGLRYNLDSSERLAIRFDYRYIKYGKMKFPSQSSSFEVNDQLFSAGLQYFF